MGLDNGIIVKKVKIDEIDNYVKYEDYSTEDETEIEIAYWRKCWGIRQAILNALNSDVDNGDTIIHREDIPNIVDALLPFLDENYWNENSNSIWEYDVQIVDNLTHILLNLVWLATYMKDHDVVAWFYDSY